MADEEREPEGGSEPRGRAGRLVAGYRLERPLGRGGMAEVWLGQDILNGSLAALKLLHPASGHAVEELFARERRAVLRLRHPNIVPVFDVGEDYLVCAYVEGVDLRHRLRSPIAPSEAVEIACQIGSALAAAHAEGVVHCDVKPANILLDQAGTPFLSDFGIARLTEDGDAADVERVVGTPAFMAPEQMAGQPTPASDQFALAKTLLVMLGGEASETPARAVLGLAPALHETFGAVLARALQIDPADRFPDVGAFVTALRALEIADAGPVTRLAPACRSSAAFGWVAGPRSLRRFGERIVRADYRLSELVAAGLLDSDAVAAFCEATGHADFGWSTYAREERLGPIEDPLALARAKQSVVLLHGLFTSRELWQDVAVGIARDNGLAVVLVPDVLGFGESTFGDALPPRALVPAGLVRTMNAWLELIGVGRTATAVLGHSYSASALLCARTGDLGEGVHRICLTPALFFHRFALRLGARANAVLSALVFALPAGLRWLMARRLFRRNPSLERISVGARDDMARAAVRLGGARLARIFWHVASARPAPPEELERCTIVTTPDDPLVTPELTRESVAATGLPQGQWYRLVYGGHFPQLVDDDHPEWGARNVHELVSLVDGVIEMGHTTDRRRQPTERTPAEHDTSAATATLDHGARE